MDKVKIIEIKKSVLEHNELNADSLRASLKKKGVYLLNVMSSPGSGKTTTLIGLINLLKDKYKIGVMEADIDGDVDAIKIKENTGVDSIQIHTGGMCHLTAGMTKEGIDGIGDHKYDLLILENVGNLVCPAEFDTGATKSINILSVPEGDDKPLKYPLMFEVCDLVVINKIDVLPYFDFNLEKCKDYIHMRNPKAEVILISAKTHEGLDKLAMWMDNQLKQYKGA